MIYRLIGPAIGLFFAFAALIAFINGAYVAMTEPAEKGAEYIFHKKPEKLSLPSNGPFGKFDLQQVQRGYQVYKEVCAACHSLDYVAFRDLEMLGYSEAEVRAEAASWVVPGIDPDTGEASTRPGLPTDYFPSPYPNDVAAAAANNNAIPPDLSLMTKARPNGAAYVYSLLIGYQGVPRRLAENYPDSVPGPGLYYNPYFPNLNLAMAQPLHDEQVTFADGSPNDLNSMSQDLAAFLVWTAEPTLAKRNQTGWPVLGFLLFATILAYLSYRNIWAELKAKKKKAAE